MSIFAIYQKTKNKKLKEFFAKEKNKKEYKIQKKKKQT